MTEDAQLSLAARLHRRALLELLASIRYAEGRAAARLRVSLLRRLGAVLGTDVYIGPAVYIQAPWRLSIGSRVSIHEQCVLICQGGIKIGSDVSIAHSCSLLSTSHIYDRSDLPIRESGIHYAPVTISDNVWLGCGVRVLCGSIIEPGVVVGANSVVRGRMPKDTVVAGAPARVRKRRLRGHGAQ